jgi:hypothetical protein
MKKPSICEICRGSGWLIVRRDNLEEWLFDPEKSEIKSVPCYACGGSGVTLPPQNPVNPVQNSPLTKLFT